MTKRTATRARDLGNQLRIFRAARKAADTQLDLGRIYLMDGAMLSAAACYRKAATLLEKAHAARLKAMGSL